MKKIILKAGVSGYLDNMTGLVPVKVLSVKSPSKTNGPEFFFTKGTGDSRIKVTAKVTEDYKGYKKGEIIESDSIEVIPRTSVYQGEYHIKIKAYTVECDPT
jgi:hypothetical protein